jgi:hypothetical protein
LERDLRHKCKGRLRWAFVGFFGIVPRFVFV